MNSKDRHLAEDDNKRGFFSYKFRRSKTFDLTDESGLSKQDKQRKQPDDKKFKSEVKIEEILDEWKNFPIV